MGQSNKIFDLQFFSSLEPPRRVILRKVSFFDTQIRITQQNQAGLNDEKTVGRKSRWTVPLSHFVLFMAVMRLQSS